MGTYYALGIVKKFTAKSNQELSEANWEDHMNERLDIDQYAVSVKDNVIEGVLKEKVFRENIEDLYNKLVQITNDRQVSVYLEDSGTDIEQYQTWRTGMTIKEYDSNITLTVELVILFIEGKVIVEEFSIEPKLINWLFRHASLSNPLAGCIMSDIVG
ncbi:hypothetical protein [Lentibacillus cibarius]|uniref:Uncharacterized protein n=1 Tax=Lentibacillus cibarius TaxID=2583219 RepID=A0A5S3QIU4_9BACI|nr:hypothetical protein [Lentibacillus cibarius]TMN21850.1 hypothetical protein FFL34_06780 [Lentibacillus cibarius]